MNIRTAISALVILAVLILIAAMAPAQTSFAVGPLTVTLCDENHKPKGCVELTATGQVINFKSSIDWHDYIDAKGVYHADFTDPNNEFRCELVSRYESNPNNPFYDEVLTLGFVCAKPHKVDDQRSEGKKP